MPAEKQTYISTDDAGVMVRISQKPPTTGMMQVKVASAVAPGRATLVTIPDAARMNETELRKTVGRSAAGAAMRMNELYGDNLDPAATIRKADDALTKLMTTARPLAALGLFTTFEEARPDRKMKKTPDIASRASEQDPLTAAHLKGKSIADLA